MNKNPEMLVTADSTTLEFSDPPAVCTMPQADHIETTEHHGRSMDQSPPSQEIPSVTNSLAATTNTCTQKVHNAT